MGLRGISVLESSGDTGMLFYLSIFPPFFLVILIMFHKGVGAGCQTNNGTNLPTFDPQFPGTCPYVTAVGGTQSVNPEVAWTGSSGGFSNYFSRPYYQEKALTEYLSKNIEPATKEYYSQYANFSGRGFPDVAAHSLSPS